MEVGKDGLARFFGVVLPHLNEVQRRVVAGAMSEMLGRGGKTAVADASGMSRNTVIKAEREVAAGIEPAQRLGAVGGGDKPLTDKLPGLLGALDELVAPETRGNPMSLLRWTSKSSTKLADDLLRQGFEVSSRTVLRLLHQLGYSLRANAKVTEGKQHEDRDAQFVHINDQEGQFLDDGQPVISVDARKKLLIGDFQNGGVEWQPHHNRAGQGHSLRDLRPQQRRGMGVGRRHRRHRPVRRRVHPVSGICGVGTHDVPGGTSRPVTKLGQVIKESPLSSPTGWHSRRRQPQSPSSRHRGSSSWRETSRVERELRSTSFGTVRSR